MTSSCDELRATCTLLFMPPHAKNVVTRLPLPEVGDEQDD